MEQQPHNAMNGRDAVQVGAVAQRRMEGGNRSPVAGLSDMVAVMARLAQILAQEVDFLQAMRIKEIETLQEEKRKLTKLLTTMKRDFDRAGVRVGDFAEDQVRAFHEMAEIFNNVLQENQQKLLVAKEINYRVVQAISDVVEEESQRPGYNRRGTKSKARAGAPSVSLNERI